MPKKLSGVTYFTEFLPQVVVRVNDYENTGERGQIVCTISPWKYGYCVPTAKKKIGHAMLWTLNLTLYCSVMVCILIAMMIQVLKVI